MRPNVAIFNAEEAVIDLLSKNQSMYYRDLVKAAMNVTGHGSNTIALAAKRLKDVGSVKSVRVGYKTKYYFVEAGARTNPGQMDDLPVRRIRVNAATLPKIGGCPRSPFEWTVDALLGRLNDHMPILPAP